MESQKFAQPDMDGNGSPSSVLDREDNEDASSSAMETSSSFSREAVREVVEKDEVSSPHASTSDRPIDELQANNPVNYRSPGSLGDKNGGFGSQPGSSVTQLTKKPNSEELLSRMFRSEPLGTVSSSILTYRNPYLKLRY